MRTHAPSQAFLIAAALVCPAAAADSNINDASKFAWAENIGWTNWRDADSVASGVTVDLSEGFLSGFIWSENTGWISTGGGDGPYSNLTGETHGVNILLDGTLDGFAWGENIGWINFGTAAHIGPDGARIDLTENRLRGYAWAENVGWINLDNAEFFIAFSDCPGDLTGDGSVGSPDLGALLAAWGQGGGPADLTGDGDVGSPDLGALLAAWGPCE